MLDTKGLTNTFTLPQSDPVFAVPGYKELKISEDFEILGEIGKGGNASVFIAKFVNPLYIQEFAAFKQINERVDQNAFKLEVAILG